MIEKNHKSLSINRQCKLLQVNRNRLQPKRDKISEDDKLIMREIDVIHLRAPFYGQRNIQWELAKIGWKIGRNRVRRLMQIMGVVSLAPMPNTSKPCKANKVYPYLVKKDQVTEANQVWCTDITYLPMEKGHAYLIAIMDWHSRAILSWEVSNIMDTAFCIRALREAIKKTGTTPKMFNTDQGSQFTSKEWIAELNKHDITISMDGKGRWADNVFIERVWRSLKYERIRLYSYGTIPELRQHVDEWMHFYNHERPHHSHEMQTPWSIYQSDSKAA